ncbi:hypothetical protein VWA41_14485, partial [Klebsiella pneumoniae]|nr:hypothetical protein [Klebsiella pneumoniae]
EHLKNTIIRLISKLAASPNAFIVAIGLYWAISILLELLIKRLTAWGAKRGMSHA